MNEIRLRQDETGYGHIAVPSFECASFVDNVFVNDMQHAYQLFSANICNFSAPDGLLTE